MNGARLLLKTVSIRRDGCFSVLKWREEGEEDGRPFAVSLERTFEPGEAEHGKRIVIPAGVLVCKRTNYIRGGYPTFAIEVPGHTRVLFHKGNREEDSEACVLVAESFTTMGMQAAIGDSKGGFAELMELAKGLNQFEMEVSGR